MEAGEEGNMPPGAAGGLGKRRIKRRRALGVFGSLLFATIGCVSMVCARSIYLHARSDTFLLWNLTLAWIPALFSFASYRFYGFRRRRNLLFLLCALAWFVFFPNAPYIVTDFVHLEGSHPVPLWFDILTVASFAWTGLCLGYLSLYLMQEIVRARIGWGASWVFVFMMLALGSVGVYMGRFMRLNSWDVLRHPGKVFHDSVHLTDPDLGTITFTLMLYLFLLMSYFTIFSLTHLHEDEPA